MNKKIVIGIFLVVFGCTLIVPAIIGVILICRGAKDQKKNNEMAAKRKRILNVAHPGKFLLEQDHAWLSCSSCCPVCSLYNRRIYSVSGKDKRFPPLVSLPDAMHDGKCDVCNCYYSLCTWFEGISNPDIVTAIQTSNAPLVDKRTPEQIEHFEKKQAKEARKKMKEKRS